MKIIRIDEYWSDADNIEKILLSNVRSQPRKNHIMVNCSHNDPRMQQKQRLGARAMRYFLLKYVFPGFLLTLLALILILNRDGIVAAILSLGALRVTPEIFSAALDRFLRTYAWFSIAAMGLGVIISLVEYYSEAYAFDDFDLRLWFGILSIKEMAIPYRQVQNVNIVQSLVMRIFGVGKVEILTAGNDRKDADNESEGMFEVMDIVLAQKLKEHLLDKAGVQLVKEV